MSLWILFVRTPIKVVGVSQSSGLLPSPRLLSLCYLRLKREHLVLFFLLGNVHKGGKTFFHIWPFILEPENQCEKILYSPIFAIFTNPLFHVPPLPHTHTFGRRNKRPADPEWEVGWWREEMSYPPVLWLGRTWSSSSGHLLFHGKMIHSGEWMSYSAKINQVKTKIEETGSVPLWKGLKICPYYFSVSQREFEWLPAFIKALQEAPWIFSSKTGTVNPWNTQ